MQGVHCTSTCLPVSKAECCYDHKNDTKLKSLLSLVAYQQVILIS